MRDEIEHNRHLEDKVCRRNGTWLSSSLTRLLLGPNQRTACFGSSNDEAAPARLSASRKCSGSKLQVLIKFTSTIEPLKSVLVIREIDRKCTRNTHKLRMNVLVA